MLKVVTEIESDNEIKMRAKWGECVVRCSWLVVM